MKEHSCAFYFVFGPNAGLVGLLDLSPTIPMSLSLMEEPFRDTNSRAPTFLN